MTQEAKKTFVALLLVLCGIGYGMYAVHPNNTAQLALLSLAGLVVMLTPAVAQAWHEYNQQDVDSVEESDE